MAVVNAAFAAWYYRLGLASKRKQSEQDIPVKNHVEDAASASVAIVIAALSKTAVKGAAAIALGAGQLRRAIAIATGSIVAAGVAAILLG